MKRVEKLMKTLIVIAIENFDYFIDFRISALNQPATRKIVSYKECEEGINRCNFQY